MNQIQTLIANHIQGDDRKREELIRNLGFEHLEEARKLLGDLERTGEVHSKLVRKNLHRALGLEAYVVHNAFLCDKDQQVEAQEIEEVRSRHGKWKEFKPVIQVLTEREIPNPIFVAALTGSYRRKTIHLDEGILALPETEQFAAVTEIVKKHYSESRVEGKEGGYIIAFGAITQYEFRQTYYRTVGFDIHGRFIGSRWGKHAPMAGKAELFIGKKEVSDRLGNLMFGQRQSKEEQKAPGVAATDPPFPKMNNNTGLPS